MNRQYSNSRYQKYIFLLLSIYICVSSAQAQIRGKLTQILGHADTLLTRNEKVDMPHTADSNYVKFLEQRIKEAEQKEATLQTEITQLRLQGILEDSIRHAQQYAQIDSLRQITPGVPMTVDEDTLFYFYIARGGVTPQMRAQNARLALEKIGKKLVIKTDSVKIEKTDIVSDIMYGNQVLFSITDRDALWEKTSRDSLAQQRKQIVVDKLQEMKEEYGLIRILKRIAYFILVVAGQWLLFLFTNWIFRKLRIRIDRLKDTRLKPFMLQNYELLDTDKQVRLLQIAANLFRYLFMLVQLLFSVPLVFIIFPQTEKLAFTLLGYLLTPVKNILTGIVDYIPNLFTIVVIWFAVKYLIRMIHYLAKEIEEERLQINGFYSDWAMPTYQIIRFLLYAFMIAMIYPYLPGSNSGVFQGISVFVGLIVSLGSTTVIGNIIAGLVITYMRPFKLGDQIKLNDTTGNVIEKTPLVTRIRTPKNEVVTIPNSFMMSSHTVNYSASAREYGLIIHSEVTIGYDAPWRLVHELLIDAALNTPGVVDSPRPFVLQTSLSDWYPVYQVNAYIKNAEGLQQTYSILHQNIQDRFNEAGVEIMSPHYMAMRDGNETTIPKNDLRNEPKYKQGPQKK